MDNLQKRFYDFLAVDYDRMIEFHRRLKIELPAFRAIAEKYNLKTALDAGCGTGFHSVILSKIGMKVTAADNSEEMLKLTIKNTKKFNLKIKTIKTDLAGLKKTAKKEYDSVFCLGNTLAHLLTKKTLNIAIKNFYGLLNSKGVIVLQILNYNRILKNRERIQNIKKAGDKTFIRFYDYGKEFVLFNILKLEQRRGQIIGSLHSVRLRPWLFTDIVYSLKRSGFIDIGLYGNLNMDRYRRLASKDFVVIARKK